MSGISIDLEETFKESLSEGINLFTGAGFSCLPDDEGNKLPLSKELSKSICMEFGINARYFDDLGKACALAPPDLLQDFLRKKFKVNKYNRKYDSINKISLKSIITTNIDNILDLVLEKSSRYYVENLQEGAVKKSECGICYIPLHGNVNSEGLLSFDQFDIAKAGMINSDLFYEMKKKMTSAPTLFWGYSLSDSSVQGVIGEIIKEYPQKFWIQCMPDSYNDIDFYREMGCHVIISNTDDLLSWIDKNLRDDHDSNESNLQFTCNKELKKYKVPTLNDVEAVSINRFFQMGYTSWHPILSNQIHEIENVSLIYEEFLKHNIIIVDGEFSGKTTVLMQLAVKVPNENKFYFENIDSSFAKFFVSKVDNDSVCVFIENCTDDIETLNILASKDNIKIAATARDYNFETSKHLLTGKYFPLSVGEISRKDALRIFSTIPVNIRRRKMKYKESNDDRFAMLEMILNNVSNIESEERIVEIFKNIRLVDKESFDLLCLTTYLVSRSSALSTDIIMGFFGLTKLDEVNDLIKKVNSLLHELNVSISPDNDDQDYYTLRSKLFLRKARYILDVKCIFKKEYSSVIEKFIFGISPVRIWNYYAFKRKAYDAELFYKLFGFDSDRIYEYLNRYRDKGYILQQWALCQSLEKNFDSAFIKIQKAIKISPNNFSFQNSYAIILFEANVNKKTEKAERSMEESMLILEKCYLSDKRKNYHARKYAEFSLIFAKRGNCSYVEQALKWLNEITGKSKLVLDLQEDLKEYKTQNTSKPGDIINTI